MIEVEIRAKIKNIDPVRKKILNLGAKHVKTEKQIDKIFGRPEDLDKEHKIIEGHFSARVRQKSNKIFIQLKEIRRAGAGLEFSSSVNKMEDGVYFLQKLNYEEAFTVSKTRELYELDDFEICLDQVNGLGVFIEIEHKVKDNNEKEKLIQKCKDLLFRIDSGAIVEPKKYGDLMQDIINKRKMIDKNDKKEIKELIDLFKEAEKLKFIRRFKDSTKMPEKESSADHSWRLAFLVFAVTKHFETKIDIVKALKIALVHNFYEIYSDNIDHVLIATNKITKETKEQSEKEAVEKIKKLLPRAISDEIYNLLLEFRQEKSQEAKFVKALSKLETLDHLVNCGYEVYDSPDFIANYADKSFLQTPELKALLREAKNRLKIEFEKGGIDWKESYDLN